MKRFMLIISLLTFSATLSAAAEMPQSPVTGYSWLKMSDLERAAYVVTNLYVLERLNIPFKDSPNGYVQAIETHLDKDPQLYGAEVTNILVMDLYQNEPEAK